MLYGCLYRQISHLERHMLMHTGGYAYACELCEKAYRSRIDLRTHYTHYHDVTILEERVNTRAVYTIQLPPQS